MTRHHGHFYWKQKLCKIPVGTVRVQVSCSVEPDELINNELANNRAVTILHDIGCSNQIILQVEEGRFSSLYSDSICRSRYRVHDAGIFRCLL